MMMPSAAGRKMVVMALDCMGRAGREGQGSVAASAASHAMPGSDPRVNPCAAVPAPVYTATGQALDILDSVAERALAVQ